MLYTMKKSILIPLFLIATALLLFYGCDEEEENKEPTCSITNPASGISITQDTTITISAEAEDKNGNLKEVRFFLDGTNIGTASSSPYNYEWSPVNVSTGTHTLKAMAIDEENATAKDEVQIFVYETVECPSSFTDNRDGQEYSSVQIGGQCWMAENLNYDQDSYGNDWCYDNDSSHCDTYGRLYDWAAFMQGESSSNTNPSGVQGICPEGWHMPSDKEWNQLAKHISNDNGGYTQDGGDWFHVGGHLKASSGWGSGNNGTDDYGFSGLPGGYCYSDDEFEGVVDYAVWWSASDHDPDYAWGRNLSYKHENFDRISDFKGYGFSVRCIRD